MSTVSQNGKGSKPRPFAVDQNTFEENWNRIFGSKEKKDHFSDDESEDTPRNRAKMRKKRCGPQHKEVYN